MDFMLDLLSTKTLCFGFPTLTSSVITVICLSVCLFVFFVDTTLMENMLHSASTVLIDVQLNQEMFMNCAYTKYLLPLWLDLLTTYCWSLECSHYNSSCSILKLLFHVILYFVFVFHEMRAGALGSHGVRDTQRIGLQCISSVLHLAVVPMLFFVCFFF